MIENKNIYLKLHSPTTVEKFIQKKTNNFKSKRLNKSDNGIQQLLHKIQMRELELEPN